MILAVKCHQLPVSEELIRGGADLNFMNKVNIIATTIIVLFTVISLSGWDDSSNDILKVLYN